MLLFDLLSPVMISRFGMCSFTRSSSRRVVRPIYVCLQTLQVNLYITLGVAMTVTRSFVCVFIRTFEVNIASILMFWQFWSIVRLILLEKSSAAASPLNGILRITLRFESSSFLLVRSAFKFLSMKAFGYPFCWSALLIISRSCSLNSGLVSFSILLVMFLTKLRL